ncbi:DNA (cytosine-5-)-methyltransferase [Psychromonas sp. psych-6C06]|uniref:DNA cytosine methyltransferase n=1 Tax=Psychromonas sp. psych-6C06 TaxID=2058089 RepID=UPI000C332DAA|nr:DNA (cytosine-5-)-methyltransferase [Psychromonas sp. psych-6C06]PKF63394.1 DNA (cytosine-5-)-methyltransferase [Psychromonas sp. psych-6C06]
MNYKVGSLFAGVGGVCLGFKNASNAKGGYQLVWANELDQNAAKTYQHNFEHPLIEGDIEKIVKPERAETDELREQYEKKKASILAQPIDILTGGFPCQAFSIAGGRKGFDDHRGNLFYSIIDLVNDLHASSHKPRVLFLENVKNLRGHDKGRTYQVIKAEIEAAGYIVKDVVLNTKEYTLLPQNRERMFIVCFLNQADADQFTMFDRLADFKRQYSDQERCNNIRRVLDLDKDKQQLQAYYYTSEKYPNYFLSESQFNSLPAEKRKKERINISEQITDEFEFYQVRRGMYVRKNANGVCPTLTANMGTGGHNVALIKVKDGVRKLTPAETFKLQGFPVGNGYSLPEKIANGQLYKQAGNAVSVDLITLIANELLSVLQLNDKRAE